MEDPDFVGDAERSLLIMAMWCEEGTSSSRASTRRRRDNGQFLHFSRERKKKMELEMEKKRLLIDADFGIDDATAILVALKHCQVAALTVCHGNVNTDQGGKRDKEEGESWVIG